MSLQESTAASPPSSPDGAPAIFVAPPSYAQERLWFLEQLDDGGSTAYNVGIGLRLTGPLDAVALERALTEVVRRHEVLRTTLALHEGSLAQFIASARPVRMDVVDLSGAAEPQAAVRAYADGMQQTPFDLEAGPVFRSVLLRTGAAEHVLLLVFDHVVCDAWSLRVVHRDLIAAYRAEVLGAARQPDPAIQYADYAQWQREWLDSGELRRQLDYWRERLADPPPKARLTAAGAAVSGTGAAASSAQPLPAQLVAGLEARGREAGASLFMTVSAAFAALLAHHTGRPDLVVGTLLANRNHAEVEDLVGFFTNTVALRLDLSGDPTVSELIARTRECTLGAYAHQDIPFHRLVEELRPKHTPGELPYFDVMIQLADIEREPAELGALRIDPVPLDSRPAPVGLVLSVLKQDGGYTAVWDYRDDWIDGPRVAALQDHFARLLGEFAAGADGAVAALSAGVPALGADATEVEASADRPEAAAAPAGDDPWCRLAASVWAEVLGYEAAELGPQDDFFELGGHSLAAGRVVSRLNRHCGRPVPIRVLFDRPVLADFAAALAEQSGAAGG